MELNRTVETQSTKEVREEKDLRFYQRILSKEQCRIRNNFKKAKSFIGINGEDT